MSNFRLLSAMPEAISELHSALRTDNNLIYQRASCIKYGLILTRIQMALRYSDR